MVDNYRTFFGLQQIPFASDLKQNEIMKTPQLESVERRFNYAVEIGGVSMVTGEIGSGKSTALRYVSGQLHPSEYKPVYIIATSGSVMELYRQIATGFGVARLSGSKALMINLIRDEILNLVTAQKLRPVMIIDESSLLRLEVLAELHTLLQFEKDAKLYLPLILAGQSTVIDKLTYRSSAPLASRVIARCHLEGLSREDMNLYLLHHLNLSGVRNNPFDDSAVTAIHQGSGGLLRKANHLARGALMAAAKQKSQIVTAEHVRLAATEII